MKDEDEAEADLIKAHELVPSDGVIESELAKIRQRKKEQREREKKAYKKFVEVDIPTQQYPNLWERRVAMHTYVWLLWWV